MKKYLSSMVVGVVAFALLVGCGGGGSSAPSASESSLETAQEAGMVAMALSGAVIDAFETIDDSSGGSTYQSLKTIKEMQSFTGTATDSQGDSCTLTGSGEGDTSVDPMTIELSGELSCHNYTADVSTSEGAVSVSMTGTVSVSMSGTIAHDYSSGALNFTLEWSGLSISAVTGLDMSSYVINGSYALSVEGNDTEMTVTEEGSIGGQDFSQTRIIGSGGSGSTEVYDYYSDLWVVYTNPTLYHGDYAKDESVNSDTCSNNFHAYAWPNAMNIAELGSTTVRFASNPVSTVFTYDAAYPHFDGSDTLTYWYADAQVACAVGIGSLPSTSTVGYEDILIFVCSDGVDVCGLDYTRENTSAIKTVKASAADPLRDEMIEKLKDDLQDELNDVLNSQ